MNSTTVVDTEKVLNAHMEEYKVLMLDVRQRVDGQEKLVNISAVLSGVLFTAYGLAIQNPAISGILLAFPFAFSMIIWLILRHDTMIFTTIDYLYNRLRPKVNTLLQMDHDSSVWLWESYWVKRHLRSGFLKSVFHRFLALVRYGVPFLLSVLSLLLFQNIKETKGLAIQATEYNIIYVGFVTIAFTFFLMAYWVGQSSSQIKGEAWNTQDHSNKQTLSK
jgi:hypothetical protein